MPNPTDALYDPTFRYSVMQTCLDEYRSEWMSLVDGNLSHALPGYNADGSAKVSDYWRCIVNVYRTGKTANDAIAAAQVANEKAALANTKAALADEKAGYAGTQGDYAKNMADHPPYIGGDGYWYHWNHSTQEYVKGSYSKGDDLDYSTITDEEKQALAGKVAEEFDRIGGYSVFPVDEDSITTTSVFRKNSILSLDGVVYIAVRQTQDLPFPMVVEDNKILTVPIYGKTVLVRASDVKSSHWDVWIDASNDIRFRQLEDRVARIESVVAVLQQQMN